MYSLFKTQGKFSHASLLMIALLSLGALASCQDEEFGYTKEEIRAASYDRNFVAKYGDIDPEQSWDFSKFAVQNFSTTRAMPSDNNCPFDNVTDNDVASHVKLDVENEWYYIEPHLLEAFNHNLAEGVDNTKQGSFNFEFTSTGAPFYIVPLFQGISGLATDLHMEVNYNGHTYDKEIWTKGQNLQKQVYGSLDWQTITETTEAYSNYHNKAEYEALYEGSSFGAIASRSKPIRCIVPAGATIKMYVHVSKGRLANNVNTTNGDEAHDNNLAYTGVKQYSDQGKMIALSESLFEVPQAAKQRFGQHAMIIGCEDASYNTETVTVYRKNGSSITSTEVAAGTAFEGATVSKWNGDNDMNDLVFMFVSDDLPDVKEKNVIRKRYLVEDLGSVVDWDFNDVVVDVYQRSENGVVVEQKAMIRQKCGTTNFDVYFKVGSKYTASLFGEHTGRVRDSKSTPDWKEPMAEVATGSEITLVDLSTKKVDGQWPWNPDQNNIVVRVYPEKNQIDESKPNIPNGDGNYPSNGTVSSEDYQNGVAADNTTTTNQQMASQGILVQFPEYGQVPRIIAVDTDFPWTDENQDIDGNLWNFTTILVTAQKDNGYDAGVASGSGKYRVGSKTTIKAIPNPGYKFKQWSDGDTNPEREITVTAGHDYEAQFESTTSVEGKNYDITIYVDGNGSINGTEGQSYPYHFSFISLKSDHTPNDDGFYIQANPNSDSKFLYWSDENGNIETSNPYYVKSTATLTAHFVENNGKKPLVIRFDHNDWTNWDHTSHPLSLHVQDGNEVKAININDKGEATYYATNDEVYVVANSLNNNQWDIVYEWSQGSDSYTNNNNGNTLTNYGGTHSLTQDVKYDSSNKEDASKNTEKDIIANFNSIPAQVKKTLTTAPLKRADGTEANGNIVTVGITSQVVAFYALREGNTVGESQNTNDVPYGEAKINGDARQVFLHKNSSFNLVATENAGYHFAGWYANNKFFSTDAITRNVINNSTDGQYFVTAVYDHNTYRNLTFNFSNWANGDAYSVTVNGVEKKLENTSGSVTFQVPEGASVKTTFKYTNKNNNDREYNAQFVLTGSDNYTAYGYDQIYMGGMPTSDMTFTVTPKYQVLAFINGENKNNDAVGTVKINGGGRVEYLEKGAAATFVAQESNGYTFDGWYQNNNRVSTEHTYTPTHNRELFIDAKFVEGTATPTLTLNFAGDAAEDFNLFINGVQTTSANVTPGSTVQIKAKKQDGKSNSAYRFMWTGISGIADSEEDAVTTFTMPETDATITCTVLYSTRPQSHLSKADNNNDVAGDGGFQYGDITLEWNGRTAKNEPIYAPIGAKITATATPKTGYRFKAWRWSTVTTATQEYTRGNDKNEIWQPQALFVEQNYTVNVAAYPAEGGTVKINEGEASSQVFGTFLEGTEITLTAAANSGWYFLNWTSTDKTLQRTLKVMADANPGAVFGKIVIDASSSPVAVASGSAWDNCRYNNNNQGAANYTALVSALGTATSKKLHVYCSEATGSISLFTFGGRRDSEAENDTWAWQAVAGTNGASLNNGEAVFELNETAINQIKNGETNHGLVIQNNSGSELHFVRLVVE